MSASRVDGAVRSTAHRLRFRARCGSPDRSLSGASARAARHPVIVGAFGNPGAEALANALASPVIGVAEAAMRAAASGWTSIRGRNAYRAAGCTDGPASTGDRPGRQLRGHAGDERCSGTLMANAAALVSAQDACPPRRRGTRPRVVIQRRPIGGVAKSQPGRVGMPVIEVIPATLHHVAAALGTSSYSLRPLPG